MQIVVVTPEAGASSDTILPALAELGGAIRVVGQAVAALDEPADVVLVDARRDARFAHNACLLLASLPVLLVVEWAAAPLIEASWGATDIVSTDASVAELRTRLHLAAAPAPLESSGIVIDEEGYKASAHGRSLDLTYTEFELLKFLVSHPNRVFSRDQLVTDVWGYDYYGGTRTVDVHVRRLRAKLGPELDGCIETVRNVGYRFSPKR